jgi:hypothetical protein
MCEAHPSTEKGGKMRVEKRGWDGKEREKGRG